MGERRKRRRKKEGNEVGVGGGEFVAVKVGLGVYCHA